VESQKCGRGWFRQNALPFGRWRASNGRPFEWEAMGATELRSGKGDLHMAKQENDQTVLVHIDGLVKEEEHLYDKAELTDADQQRLAALKVELDQCWDLLRQRRALREFGKDPEKAKVRAANVVETYEQ
jgi:hypothetical protein